MGAKGNWLSKWIWTSLCIDSCWIFKWFHFMHCISLWFISLQSKRISSWHAFLPNSSGWIHMDGTKRPTTGQTLRTNSTTKSFSFLALHHTDSNSIIPYLVVRPWWLTVIEYPYGLHWHRVVLQQFYLSTWLTSRYGCMNAWINRYENERQTLTWYSSFVVCRFVQRVDEWVGR